jgi:hypothetical protein
LACFLAEQVIDRQKRCFVSSFISDKNVASGRLFALSLSFYPPVGVPGNLFVGSGSPEGGKDCLKHPRA